MVGFSPEYAERSWSLEDVLRHLDQAREGGYVDAHVWTFTPDTLVEQLVELRILGLSAWTVDAISPTRRNELEFGVVLRRLPSDPGARSGWLEREVPHRTDMPDWLAETTRLRRRLTRRERQLARAEKAVTRQRRIIARLRRRSQVVQPPPSVLRRAARRLRRISR